MRSETVKTAEGEKVELTVCDMAEKNLLIQIFFASNNLNWIQETLDDLTKRYPNGVIVGASSFEAIHKGLVLDSCATVSATVFEDTVVMGRYEESFEDSFHIGQNVAKKLCLENTKAIIAFTDASSINGEEFLNGLSSASPKKTVVAGGLASTPTFADTFVAFQNKIIKNGVVAVSLSSDSLFVQTESAFGWRAIGQEMIVTKADKNRVESINGKTPLSIFRKYLGRNVISSFPNAGSAFPLMIKRGESLVARGILKLEGEAFIVSGNVNEGDRVYIGYGNILQISKQNDVLKNLALDVGKPQAMFAYYCIGRKMFLPKPAMEFEIKNAAQACDISGFFTLGEFFTDKDAPKHLNFSSTFLALREGEKEELKYKKLNPPRPDFINVVSEGLFNFIDARSAELDYLAYHDSLTSLANRALLEDRVEHALYGAKRNSLKVAILHIGVDRFKNINDAFGREAGDMTLSALSKRLIKIIGPENTLARVAGDEFVAILEGQNIERKAAQTADAIIKAFSKTVAILNVKASVGASVGIAMFPEDGADYDRLTKNAETAMRQAKSQGGGAYAFYRQELTLKTEKKLILQNELKIALQKEQLSLLYQPQIDLKTKAVAGAEALIRWNHPKRGVLAPRFFLEEAAECGLLPLIGESVTRQACSQIQSWLARGIKPPKISVNIAAEEFCKSGVYKRLYTDLNAASLEPQALQIEITETGIMQNKGVALEELQKINDMGVGVSIDDFGTGYSSLSYLKKLPADELKIDRSFISDIEDSDEDKAIVKAILALAKELNLSVVAEGIENKAQASFLQTEGCNIGQGFLYARPLTPKEFVSFMAKM